MAGDGVGDGGAGFPTAEEEQALLGGRYALGDLLGYGGMAEVYAAHDTRLGRAVAVKVLRADLARDPAFLARFQREAQSAAALSHPAIVSVYDTGDGLIDSGNGPQRVPYIVMEYVDGRTLRDVLQTEGRLLPRRAVEILAEVCDALDYSHRHRIVHRDVKPGNVMITDRGEVKVMDFGIARAVAASTDVVTQTAAVVGTAQYLSPEQARGEHVDARSDVYSAGCVLYELLTGRPPFLGDSPVAVAYQHVREDPTPPSLLDPELRPELDAVVLKAMAKNAANRYQTAADFADDLRRLAAGQRVRAEPVIPVAEEPTAMLGAATVVPTAVRTVETVEPERRRHGAAYALLALAVLAVFAVALVVARSAFSRNGTTSLAMPQLVGMQQSDAERTLAQDGLTLANVQPVYQKDGTVPKGQVTKQLPDSGFTVSKGYGVTLYVSYGVQQVQVPAVVGQAQDDALKNLAGVGLAAGIVTRDAAPSVAKGTVLSVAPGQGTTVGIGMRVTLTVASGTVAVPSVVGQDYDSAVQLLEAAGLAPGRIIQQVSRSQAVGTVITSNPGGTREEPVGTHVDLVVAVAPPPPSPTPSPTPSPSPSPSPTPSPIASSPSAPASSPALPPASGSPVSP